MERLLQKLYENRDEKMKIIFNVLTVILLYSCASNKVTNHMNILQSAEEAKNQKYQKECNEQVNYGCKDYIKSLYNSGKIKEAYSLALDSCNLNKKEGCATVGNLYSYDGEMTKALEYYQKGCELKDGLSCSLLAYHYYENDKLDLAMKFASDGCFKEYMGGCNLKLILLRENNDKEAVNNFIKIISEECKKMKKPETCFFEGMSLYKDKPEVAKKIIKEVCEKDKLDKACISNFYLSIKDNDKSIDIYKKTCSEYHDGDACFYLARVQEKAGNYEAKIQFAEKACEYGEAKGCDYIGSVKYAEKNYLAAERYFRIACNLHNQNACMYLGLSLGFLGKRDEEIKFLEKGCYLKNPVSCAQLVIEYSKNKDDLKSEGAAQRSCDLENGFGCYSLGVKKHKEQKSDESLVYFNKSCDQLNKFGCLGVCLINSERGNLEIAKKNYLKACELNDTDVLTCSMASDIKSNKDISANELKNKCHYDPDKPWWFWASLVALGALGASSAK